MTPQASTTVVLVHGNFLGPWSWNDVTAVLAQRGVPAVTVRLPSSTVTSTGPGGDLYEDVAHVREVLDSVAGPIVLCGHSYGGAVITEATAGAHPIVTRLVYLAGVVPNVGDSLASLASNIDSAGTEAGQKGMRLRPDGMLELDPCSARDVLFHDCSAQRADEAIAQLTLMNPIISTQPVRAAGWHTLPVTYIRCVADRIPEMLSPALPLQRVELLELPTGHCPHWSRPDLVGELLAVRTTHQPDS
jgi:pimeloyl-ACP methyl ester carboxylesterase